jgi:hypothetical protein
MADRAHLERLTRDLIDAGKLIEAGWVSLRIAGDLIDTPADQLREMQIAFFAGAQHLFGSIMSVLDPGAEPTDKDMERLDSIDKELKTFIKEFEKKLSVAADTPAAKPEGPVERLGDAPIEQAYRDRMNELGRYLDLFWNGDAKGAERKTCFVFLACAFGDEGRVNYISNGNRKDVVAMMKHQIKRFEGQPDMTGHA